MKLKREKNKPTKFNWLNYIIAFLFTFSLSGIYLLYGNSLLGNVNNSTLLYFLQAASEEVMKVLPFFLFFLFTGKKNESIYIVGVLGLAIFEFIAYISFHILDLTTSFVFLRLFVIFVHLMYASIFLELIGTFKIHFYKALLITILIHTLYNIFI